MQAGDLLARELAGTRVGGQQLRDVLGRTGPRVQHPSVDLRDVLKGDAAGQKGRDGDAESTGPVTKVRLTKPNQNQK